MTPPIPFFAAEREWAAVGAELTGPIHEALATGRWLQGPQVAAFEDALAALTGRAHAVAVASGTDALFFALAACGIGAGDEVLVPDLSFIATASAVVRAGARPVWCDVDDHGVLDLDAAAPLVSERTAALIAVPLFGRPLDTAACEAFAARHGLALIEDAAQALGAGDGVRASGGVGAVSCLSFDPTKPLAAPGSGGALLTGDDALAGAARRLRWHGKDGAGRFATLGYNSQLPTASAAVLHAKLAHEPAWRARRAAIAARYAERLAGVVGLVLPEAAAGAGGGHPGAPAARTGGGHLGAATGTGGVPAGAPGGHSWSKFVVRVGAGRREALREALEAQRVPALVHYAAPLHTHPLFAAVPPLGRPPARARQLTREVLSLPVHPFLTDAEVDRAAGAVVRHLGRPQPAGSPSGRRRRLRRP